MKEPFWHWRTEAERRTPSPRSRILVAASLRHSMLCPVIRSLRQNALQLLSAGLSQAPGPWQHFCRGRYVGVGSNSRRPDPAERNNYQVPVLYSSLDADGTKSPVTPEPPRIGFDLRWPC